MARFSVLVARLSQLFRLNLSSTRFPSLSPVKKTLLLLVGILGPLAAFSLVSSLYRTQPGEEVHGIVRANSYPAEPLSFDAHEQTTIISTHGTNGQLVINGQPYPLDNTSRTFVSDGPNTTIEILSSNKSAGAATNHSHQSTNIQIISTSN